MFATNNANNALQSSATYAYKQFQHFIVGNFTPLIRSFRQSKTKQYTIFKISKIQIAILELLLLLLGHHQYRYSLLLSRVNL